MTDLSFEALQQQLSSRNENEREVALDMLVYHSDPAVPGLLFQAFWEEKRPRLRKKALIQLNVAMNQPASADSPPFVCSPNATTPLTPINLGCISLFVALFMSIGLFMFGSGLKSMFGNWWWLSGTTTQAQVIHIEPTRLTYRINDGDTVFQDSVSITPEAYEQMDDISTIEVVYLGRRSQLAENVGLFDGLNFDIFGLGFVLFGSVWLIIIGLIPWEIWRIHTRETTLRDGTPCEGTISSCYCNYNSQNGEYSFSITYTLVSPQSGKTLEGSETTPRYKKGELKPIPQKGMPVEVRYLNDQRFVVV